MAGGRAPRTAAALLAAGLLLAACGGVDRDAASGDARAAGQRGASPESYRLALVSATKPVSAALAGIAGAKALKALSQRLVQAEQAAGQAAD